VSGPIWPGATAHGARRPTMHSGQTATWASAWRPSPARIQPATGDVARERQARSRRGRRAHDCVVARSPTARWRLASGKVLSASTSGTPGWRRARCRDRGLTEAKRRRRDDDRQSGRWHPTAAARLQWSSTGAVRSCRLRGTRG
jgi:hypothetical protein